MVAFCALVSVFFLSLIFAPQPALAQSHRFDMGSPLAAGFQAVDPATLYNDDQRFGWLTPPASSISRSGIGSQFALEEANFPATGFAAGLALLLALAKRRRDRR